MESHIPIASDDPVQNAQIKEKLENIKIAEKLGLIQTKKSEDSSTLE